MKIAILTSRFPYPLEKGDKLRMYYQIKELSQQHEITLLSLTEQSIETAHLQHMQQFCHQIHIFPLTKWRIAIHLIRGLFLGFPLQVAYFYSPVIKNKISNIIHQLQPDHIYCQLIRMAPYAQDLPFPKTIDYMDTFSAGMQRRAQRSHGFLKMIFHREARQIKRFEATVFEKFDHHTIISEQDRDLLNIPEKNYIHIIPNGVDTKFFSPKPEPNSSFHLAFVGNMGYHPNVTAAKYLVNKILPLVNKEHPDIKTLIAGARPTGEVQNLQSEQVEITGWVEDIRDAYGNARIFVAPIFLGSGQQNKILEAMSMGLPCITTSMVNNAIGAPVNKAILLADDPETFASQILYLLANPEEQQKIGRAARAFVEQNYSWQHSVSIFAKLFEKNRSGNEF